MTNLLSINKIVVDPLLSTNAISKLVMLIGICLLGTVPLCAQSTSKENVEAAIDAVTDQYYYTHLDSALYYYRQAAQTAKAQGWWDTYLYAVLHMAWCADNHGHIDTLRYFLNEAETTVARHREALDTSRTYPSLLSDVPYTRGVYYYATGDFAKAADAFRPILAQPAAGLDSMLAYETYTYLGSAYYRLENYQQAIRHYEAAERWLPRYHENFAYRERSYFLSLNAMYLGQCYYAEAIYQQEEKNYQPSLALYHQALSLLSPHQEQLIYQNALVSNYHLLADIHQRLQEYDSALYYLKEVVALSQEDRLRTHILFGNTFAAAKDYPSALDHYRKSQVLSEQKHKRKHYEKAIPLYKLGQVYARQQQWDTALTYYQQALGELVEEFAPGKDVYQNPHFKTSGAKKELLEVLLLKAEALWGQYRQDPGNTQSLLSALEVYHLMTEVVDDMRRVFPSIDYKQFLTSKFYTIYQQAIQAAYQAHQSGLPGQDFLAEAFYFSEKGKSIALLEALKNAEAEAFAGIPAGLLQQERMLKQKLSYWENEVYRATRDSARQAARGKVFETQTAYNAFVENLEQTFPKYYQLKYNTKVTTLAELQASLPEHTAMLAFSYGNSSVYTFGITASDITLHRFEAQTTFQKDLKALLHSISRYDFEKISQVETYQDFVRQTHGLYQALIQPTLEDLPDDVQQLIFVPDGPLCYLPFEILLTSQPADLENINYQLPYLLKRFPVSYEYSATLWENAQQRSPADMPAYAYVGFAPVYEKMAATAASREVRTTMDGQLISISPLRHNQEEVEQAMDLFGGITFMGKNATETAFKTHAAQGSILHLSMHAYANSENQQFSGLVFTQNDSIEDGFLHTYELYNMQLQANLAILSACETGAGLLARGEGVMSLGRAFKYAGCPNVAMSLWTVDDLSASNIISQFCGHLKDGTGKDEALRQAKLTYLENARSTLAHPYYWAPFVLVGNSQPLPQAKSSYFWLILITGLCAVGLAVWIFWKRQRKTSWRMS